MVTIKQIIAFQKMPLTLYFLDFFEVFLAVFAFCRQKSASVYSTHMHDKKVRTVQFHVAITHQF